MTTCTSEGMVFLWKPSIGLKKPEELHLTSSIFQIPLDVTPSLRRSLVVNPSLKIFVASGIYDLVTPFSGADYCFTHLGLPKIFYSNVQLEDYPAGHMMYLDKAVHVKLKNDLVKFYLSAD